MADPRWRMRIQDGESKMVDADPRWRIQDGGCGSKMADPRWRIQDGGSKMADRVAFILDSSPLAQSF